MTGLDGAVGNETRTDSLHGQRVVVCGAGSGIGRATAYDFVARVARSSVLT